jgi:hypothetical protein
MKHRCMAVWLLLVTTVVGDPAYAEECPDSLKILQWRQQGRALINHREEFIEREKVRIILIANPVEQARARINLHQRVAAINAKINADQARFPALFLDQEIRNFPLARDADCLVWAMQRASGQDLKFTLYTDGKYDLTLGGKKIRDRISGAELLSIAKSLR